jgi:hypothetical protein
MLRCVGKRKLSQPALNRFKSDVSKRQNHAHLSKELRVKPQGNERAAEKRDSRI